MGAQPTLSELEAALSGDKKFKMVTVTHVDTSTGVLTDVKVCGTGRAARARRRPSGVDPHTGHRCNGPATAA